METKEHLFFLPLVLPLYLPFVTRGDLVRSMPTRVMAMAGSFSGPLGGGRWTRPAS